jgi:hypothetical protein
MKTFDAYRLLFTVFYQAVRDLHTESPRKHRGHGLDHDVTVAQLSVIIAPDDAHTADKAWVASLVHSVDRLVAGMTVSSAIRALLSHLPADYFTSYEMEEIFLAALHHNEKNKEGQSLTQQVLMDADRLANLQPTVIIRAGQFQPDIPPFELAYLSGNNPASTYHEPQSIIDDLRTMISEYIPQLRMPNARVLGEEYVRALNAYMASVRDVYQRLGLENAIL